jgi:hypothetical protein
LTPDGWLAILGVRGSIAAAMLAWAAAEWLRWRVPSRAIAARRIWTAGAFLAVIHAVAVFHFIHGWSHEAALAHTARQTAALTGLDWSWGLYVNYAFIALWLVDAAWWWWDRQSYEQRNRHTNDALLAIFLFMFINGGVIFAPWPARGVGIAAIALVIWSRWTIVGIERRTRSTDSIH